MKCYKQNGRYIVPLRGPYARTLRVDRAGVSRRYHWCASLKIGKWHQHSHVLVCLHVFQFAPGVAKVDLPADYESNLARAAAEAWSPATERGAVWGLRSHAEELVANAIAIAKASPDNPMSRHVLRLAQQCARIHRLREGADEPTT